MGIKASRSVWAILGVGVVLSVSGPLLIEWFVSVDDEPAAVVAARPPVGDARTVSELMEERFADLTPESVDEECTEWAVSNHTVFGQPLQQIYRDGSVTSNVKIVQLFADFRSDQVKQYELKTQDSKLARISGATLLTAWAELADDSSAASYDRMKTLIDKAISAGATDPLVKLIELMYVLPGDNMKGKDIFQGLPEKLEASEYGTFFQLLCQHNRFKYAIYNEAINSGAIAEQLTGAAVAYSEEYSADSKLTRVTWFYLFQAFRPPLRESEREEMFRQLLISEGTDRLFQHCLAGYLYREQAVRARGGGFIDTVSDDAQQDSGQLFAMAAMHYRKAWLLRPEFSPAASAMVELTNVSRSAGPWDSRQWFELCCQSQFDFQPAYTHYLSGLRPRWGGDYFAMLDFGKECAATKAFETNIPFMIVDCVSEIASETPRGTTWQTSIYVDALTDFWQSLDDWGDRTENDRLAPQWQRQDSLRAAVMIRNHRYEEARQALDDASWPPLTEVMQDVVVDPILSASMAYAMTDAHSESLMAIEKQHSKGAPSNTTEKQILDAISILATAKKSNSLPRAQRYFSVREHSLKQHLLFIKGDWVNLTFDTPLTQWMIQGGEAVVETETSILMSNLPIGATSMQAIPNVAFAAPYLVKATLERVHGSNFFPRLSINVGPVSQAIVLSKPGGMVFMFDDQPRSAGTVIPNGRQNQVYFVPDLEDTATMTLNIQPDHYLMFINEQQVPVLPMNVFRPSTELSFGGNPYESSLGQIRLSNVQIRRVDRQTIEAMPEEE